MWAALVMAVLLLWVLRHARQRVWLAGGFLPHRSHLPRVACVRWVLRLGAGVAMKPIYIVPGLVYAPTSCPFLLIELIEPSLAPGGSTIWNLPFWYTNPRLVTPLK